MEPSDPSLSAGQAQLLSLKVMRLSRPRLAASIGPSADPCDPISVQMNESLGRTNADRFPLGDMIVAPVQFENIYLGETFSFLVNCVNECPDEVKNVVVKVELQTCTQRHTLNNIMKDCLNGHDSMAEVFSHEVKEAGQHILVCSVTYVPPLGYTVPTPSGGEPLLLRKFFKFPVTKPIDVKTKLYNAGEDNTSCDVFLEAAIENTATQEMLLTMVSLDPSLSYICTPIRAFDSAILLQPGDIFQVLFGLCAKKDAVTSKEITKIGKIDMEWRTRMGEKGRLQTSALERIVPGYGELALKVDRLPSSVPARNLFDVECSLHNSCDHSLDVRLFLDSSVQSSLVFCSPSGIPLGQIHPRAYISFNLKLLAVQLGFQSISGIRVEDSVTKRVYEFDDIAQVFVV